MSKIKSRPDQIQAGFRVYQYQGGIAQAAENYFAYILSVKWRPILKLKLKENKETHLGPRESSLVGI